MPIYEYLCHGCRQRSSVLVLSMSNPMPAACRHCGSTKVERLLSRFAAPKSEEARFESLGDPGGLDEQDPESVARFMKNMGNEMGEDLGDDVDGPLDSPTGIDE